MPSGGPPIEDQVDALDDRAYELYAWWHMWKQLFAGSSHRIAVLNEIAPDFFVFLQISFRDSVLMALCRLTDLPNSGKFANLSLRRAVEQVGTLKDSRRQRRLTAAMRVLDRHADEIRHIRDKRLAHNDLPTAMGTAALTRPEFKVIDRAVFCAVFVVHLLDVEVRSASVSYPFRGCADVLFNHLEMATAFRDEVAAGRTLPDWFGADSRNTRTQRRRNWWY